MWLLINTNDVDDLNDYSRQSGLFEDLCHDDQLKIKCWSHDDMILCVIEDFLNLFQSVSA